MGSVITDLEIKLVFLVKRRAVYVLARNKGAEFSVVEDISTVSFIIYDRRESATQVMRVPSFFLAFACFQYNLMNRQVLGARGPIQDAIASGAAAEYNREKCTWRTEYENKCPDPDIHVYMHKYGKERMRLEHGLEASRNWLNNDLYDEKRENIYLVHGYNGGVDSLPVPILREAYLKNGSYNVWSVDWGKLGASPCYPAAVANLRFVAKCIAQIFANLVDLGMPIQRTTCVGHSLGAHLCGIMANTLPFKMNRIIALDPAKPFVRPGRLNRLDSGDAKSVQVVHTNSGYYGENMPQGDIDFCANGGKSQPFCESAERQELCSHNWSICYLADSIDGLSPLYAEPCSGRCPPLRRIGPRSRNSLVFGQHTPIDSKGTYCVTALHSPYCPKHDQDRGDKRCCV